MRSCSGLARLQGPTRWCRQPSSSARSRSTVAAGATRFAVVGDVHEKWCAAADGAALRAVRPDHVLFVGDLGNRESPELVAAIAALPIPKSVILGNHDAWTQLSARPVNTAPKRSRVTAAPADTLRMQQLLDDAAAGGPGINGSGDGSNGKAQAGGDSCGGWAAAAAASGGESPGQQPPPQPPRCKVRQQLELLGEQHVGYGEAPLAGQGVTVVGGRPFSKGGNSWKSIAPFMSAVCGVDGPEASAARIVAASEAAAARGDAIVLLAHNGPSGLGASRSDICGVDWRREQGDHGDTDLRAALDQLAARDSPAAAVVFGHMHHTLRGGGLRRMVLVDGSTGTTYLNAATVPRVTSAPDAPPGSTLRHFLVFEMEGGAVESARDVWVRVSPVEEAPAAAGNGAAAVAAAAGAGSGKGGPGAAEDAWRADVASEREVLRTVRRDGGTVKMVWSAHKGQWDPVVVNAAPGGGSGGGNGNGGSRKGKKGAAVDAAAVATAQVVNVPAP